jgi:hypothetical protein
MLMKVFKGYALLFLVLALFWIFASPGDARQFSLSVLGGAIAGWVVSHKRCMTSEGFRLVDHYGNLRAELGLRIPAHVQAGGPLAGARQGASGEELDTPPGLDLYRKNGEKAATLSLDSGQDGIVSLVLYGPGGHSRTALINGGMQKGLVIMNGESSIPSASVMMSADGEPSIELVGLNGKTLKHVSP